LFEAAEISAGQRWLDGRPHEPFGLVALGEGDGLISNPLGSHEDLNLCFLLDDASRLLQTLFDLAVKPLRITRAKWRVLTCLESNALGATQTDIALALNVGKANVGGVIE
jgi:hypothetical protein